MAGEWHAIDEMVTNDNAVNVAAVNVDMPILKPIASLMFQVSPYHRKHSGRYTAISESDGCGSRPAGSLSANPTYRPLTAATINGVAQSLPQRFETMVRFLHRPQARLPFGTRCNRPLGFIWLVGNHLSSGCCCGREAQRPKLFVRLLCRRVSLAAGLPRQALGRLTSTNLVEHCRRRTRSRQDSALAC